MSRCAKYFGIEFHAALFYHAGVKVAPRKKEKTEVELLDQATGSLLRAVKRKMLKKGGVDYSKLRKDGYSERFLAKLEQA